MSVECFCSAGFSAGKGHFRYVERVFEERMEYLYQVFARCRLAGHDQTALRISGCKFVFKRSAEIAVVVGAVADFLMFINCEDS